jgi:hypothetical protein
MRKREWLLLFVSIMLLIAGAACWILTSPRSSQFTAKFDMLKDGMNEEEVEAILGGPAGDYRTGETRPPEIGLFVVGPQHSWCPGTPLETKVWYGDDGDFTLYFNFQGEVVDKAFSPMELVDPPIREKIRRWLGL